VNARIISDDVPDCDAWWMMSNFTVATSGEEILGFPASRAFAFRRPLPSFVQQKKNDGKNTLGWCGVKILKWVTEKGDFGGLLLICCSFSWVRRWHNPSQGMRRNSEILSWNSSWLVGEDELTHSEMSAVSIKAGAVSSPFPAPASQVPHFAVFCLTRLIPMTNSTVRRWRYPKLQAVCFFTWAIGFGFRPPNGDGHGRDCRWRRRWYPDCNTRLLLIVKSLRLLRRDGERRRKTAAKH